MIIVSLFSINHFTVYFYLVLFLVVDSYLLFFLVIFQANAKAAFDETLEGHVRLAVDQKRSELVCVKSRREQSFFLLLVLTHAGNISCT